MNAQLSRLRTLVLKDLDPSYCQFTELTAAAWLREVPRIEMEILDVLQAEVLGDTEGSLVERHVKQVQYDCVFLLNTLYKYSAAAGPAAGVYEAAECCLQQILTHIESRYAGYFNRQQDVDGSVATDDYRIRVLLSAESLAYFFKLLHKAGALDAGPVSRMIVSLTKNFTTRGIGNGQLSSYSLMTKYKQVVQRTATAVRALLVKMLKLLDEEFKIS